MRIQVTQLRLSFSGAQTWLTCRQKWYWNYDQNIKRKETSRALQVGGIVHELLHKFYIQEDLPTDLEAYIQQEHPENQGPESAMVAKEALTLVLGYLNQYSNDPLTVISSEMKIEVPREEPESGQIYNIYVIIDSVVRTQDQRLWRMEHKTTARMDNYYLSGLRAGLQGGIYHYCLNKTMPEPVVGTIYNMLVKTKIPQYARMPVLMESKLAERAIQTFDGVARQIFLGDIFPDAGSCFSFNRECQYLPLCNAIGHPEQLERIKKSFYQDYYPTEGETKEGGDTDSG
jgi:hypothetical protein